jgi:hypothetical protein
MEPLTEKTLMKEIIELYFGNKLPKKLIIWILALLKA